MARLQTLFAVLLSVLLLNPGSPRADTSCEQGSTAAFINLRIGEYYPDCPLDLVPGLLFVYVDVRSVPMSEVHFSIPDPPYGTIVGAQWNFPASGNPQTGIDISVDPCSAGGWSVTLGYLLVVVPSGLAPECVTWKANDGAEVVDCEGVVRPASSTPFPASVGGGGCLCCLECWYQPVPAYDLAPANGATSVPLDVSLTWQGTNFSIYEANCSVQIGTDPDCATWTRYSVVCAEQSFAPGFLQHGTTYYWRVSWGNNDGAASSPARSFTTQSLVSVSTTTWGRVKAMYK